MAQNKIQVIINGKKEVLKKKNSLSQLLDNLKIKQNGIAIEINSIVIPKSQYENTFIQNNDNIEIVHFIGGG